MTPILKLPPYFIAIVRRLRTRHRQQYISDPTKIQFKNHKITFGATEFYQPMQSPAPIGFRLIDIRNESSKFNNYPEHDFIHQKTL